MTCSTASNSGKFAWSGVGIGEGTTLKGITFRLSDFFFNKGLEHESGFFIATPRIASCTLLQSKAFNFTNSSFIQPATAACQFMQTAQQQKLEGNTL